MCGAHTVPMFLRIAVCAVVLFAASLAPDRVLAQEPDELNPCSDLLETAGAGSACTLEAGRVLLQLAFERERGEEASITFPQAFLRFGVHRNTEVHIAPPSIKRTFDETTTSRSTDFGLGLKQIVVRSRTTLAFLVDATVPTGNDSAGFPTWQGGFSAGYAANRRVNLVANLMIVHAAGNSGNDATRLISGFGVELEPFERTELEIEISKDGSRSSELETTLQRLIGSGVAARLTLGQGSGPDGPSSSVSFGLTFLK
jgi:hypothetical protein